MPVSGKLQNRNIFGWCMYDWANSAYMTTVGAAFLPDFFLRVVAIDGSTAGFQPAALWAWTLGLASLLAFVVSPFLGAVADSTAAKKKFLLSFAYTGAAATMLLSFTGEGDTYLTLGLLLLVQLSFIGANVFYDAFLPDIVEPAQADAISAKGYSYGYVGGGLHFALSLGLYAGHDWLGIGAETAVRMAILSAGLWWGGFALVTAFLLRETGKATPIPARYASYPRVLGLAAAGASRTLSTTRRVGRYGHLVLFLVAFMLYNDGVQTVIQMATPYGRELNVPTGILMLTLLITQPLGAVGSLLFSRLAGFVGTRAAIMSSLTLWTGVVTFAYFIDSEGEFMILGALVGIVLGGTQALSRSYYSSMIPPEASAEFFGFFTVFSKFSSIWGLFVFGAVTESTGTARPAILFTAVFFLAGLVLLGIVNESKARRARTDPVLDPSP